MRVVYVAVLMMAMVSASHAGDREGQRVSKTGATAGMRTTQAAEPLSLSDESGVIAKTGATAGMRSAAEAEENACEFWQGRACFFAKP